MNVDGLPAQPQPNKVFLPQAVLDRWIMDGTVDLHDAELTLALPGTSSGRKYVLSEAVHVLREVTGEDDPFDLVGRVKPRAMLEERGAEILEGSMLLGDHAYDVALGWFGAPVGTLDEHLASHGHLPAAAPSVPPAPPPAPEHYYRENPWSEPPPPVAFGPPPPRTGLTGLAGPAPSAAAPMTDEDILANYLLKAL